jgi:pilus assembly protein FimV
MLAGLLPACAVALGLGEVQPKSYLNQPLAADIPVISESPGEIAGLNVSLASQETFSQYGLQRPAFLNDLTFSVVPGPRGAVIRISSPRPVAEPFVTLLVEVRWPQGRLLREYTVLLDPPAFAGEAAPRQPVETPAAMSTAEPARAQPAPVATAQGPAPAAAGLEEGTTHTVSRNETLWGIAERYRPDRTTDINRVMLAIYRANPEAFAGNINRLRAGAVLRMPGTAAVQSLGRAEAQSEVSRQNLEWRGTSARDEGAARLELVPPRESVAAAPAPSAEQDEITKLKSEAEESRRLLAIKDAELQALRDRIAELEKPAAEVAVEEPALEPAVPAEQPAAVPPPAEQAAPARPTTPRAAATPARPSPAEATEGGILDAITDMLTSPWLWAGVVVAGLAAWMLVRRRSYGEDVGSWRPAAVPLRGESAREAGPSDVDSDDMIVVEEPRRAQTTAAFERRTVPRGGEETPLERTISTEGAVNLDQADPLAEADFHMAYGLYDQAADLLTAALAKEPARRDLHLKLLDVYFVWENREGFLKEARALRERVASESDPDWKRVVIMGKQLCPTEPLFAGAAATAADEMDLALTADAGATGNLSLGDTSRVDFDLSSELDVEAESATGATTARAWSSAQTQELQTIEAPAVASTMETPTIENPAVSRTMETPTVEAPIGERTLETPTVETTARVQASSGEERAETTAEIDLEDLGLDLTGLDEAARNMATGLQEALPEDATALDFDVSGGVISGEGGEESTAEMERSTTLKDLAGAAMDKGDTGDTAEQPSPSDSMISPGLSATSGELEALSADLNLGGDEPSQSDLTATGMRSLRGRSPEDATMTEVGTKLDLARAYLDMGDPDGARSILNEVLEEGDPSQRQEARQLLDSLDR